MEPGQKLYHYYRINTLLSESPFINDGAATKITMGEEIDNRMRLA
jgi:hypothetical protein